MLKASVAGLTSYVISDGGSELNPLSQVSLPYCIESLLAVAGAIIVVAIFVRSKATRLVLYSFLLALTCFDLVWDLTQAFQLPIFEGIIDSSFVTAAIPTFAALHVLQNRDMYTD